MIESLYIGATGMAAQQKQVDTISNNLVNMNTVGFKKARVSFDAVMVNEISRTRNQGAELLQNSIGRGVAVGSMSRVFSDGDLRKTDRALDIAIQGEGFIEVVLADGNNAVSRGGAMQVNRDGQLTTSEGYLLKAAIQIPTDARSLVVSPEGRVSALTPNGNTIDLGKVELVRFANPSGLKSLGGNTYQVTEQSGESALLRPGEEGAGTFAQGFLELSNVKLVEEFVDLTIAQRAYEASAKIVQISDELLSITNNLRR